MQRIFSSLANSPLVLLKMEFANQRKLSESDNINYMRRLGSAINTILEKNGNSFNIHITDTYQRANFEVQNWKSTGVSIMYVTAYSVTFGINTIKESDVDSVFKIVEQVFPDCIRTVIGKAVEEKNEENDKKFQLQTQGELVAVQEKYIELETGERVYVPAFMITRDLVSVSQYLEFTNATGYKTTAHLANEENAFDSNECLESSSAEKCSAFFISKLDALAFCKWKGGSLPSSSQWLAASILDWEFFPPNSRLNIACMYKEYKGTICGNCGWTSDPSLIQVRE